MAQTKTKFEMNEMIKEDMTDFDRQNYVKHIEGRLASCSDEIKRRQEIIEKLEMELLRERRLKHSDHICENCHQPCVIKSSVAKVKNEQAKHLPVTIKNDPNPHTTAMQFDFIRLGNLSSPPPVINETQNQNKYISKLSLNTMHQKKQRIRQSPAPTNKKPEKQKPQLTNAEKELI